MNFPQWTTEIINNTVTGEDQLGIEGAAQSYQQEILPGIISVTDHARYYSFYAWILYRFIFGKDSTRLIKDFRGTFFKRHEMALILAGYLHHKDGTPFSGIVGSGTNNSKVKRFWGTEDTVSLDQDYFQNKEGGFGQYYRTSMMAMGIIEQQEELKYVYRLTNRGENLAKAYEESISGTKYFRDLQNNYQLAQISLEDAEEYAQAGCLCPEALNIGHDRPLLLDTYFRFTEPMQADNPHVKRRNSLGVALDLVFQAKGKFTREQLRPALYLGEYEPGKKYVPQVELIDWVFRWKMVEVRHMFTFGIQCLWAAFLLELDSQCDMKREDWQSWVRQCLISFSWDISVSDLIKKYSSEFGLSGDIEELLINSKETFGMKADFDEYSLYLLASKDQSNSSLLLKSGMRILLQLYLRYYTEFTAQGPIWKEIAESPRLSLDDYFEYISGKINNLAWSVNDWVNWMYQQYIFEQHEMIALEKLRYQEYDTFKFYYEENTFHWPTGKSPYKEPIRLSGNRLNNCFSMLIDLGLISETDEGNLVLTTEGCDYRLKVLEGLHDGN